jgi:WD40 repeat protein
MKDPKSKFQNPNSREGSNFEDGTPVLSFRAWSFLGFWILGVGISPLPAAPVSFSHDLAPILADKCLTCHQEKKAKGKYRVDSFEALQKPGESKDAALSAGKPDASSLYTRLVATDEDDRMPQKDDALPAAQIALFKRWIEEGAKFDGADAKAPLRELLAKKEAPKAPATYPRPLPVTALAFSADGKSIFCSGYREVLEWSTADGKLSRRIAGMPERVLALALQPGGKTLAVAGGTPGRSGELLIVDVAKGTVAHKLPGAKDTVLAACFSPDGSLLASGGTDNIVHMFRSSDWKQAWKAEAHADWIMALAFSPDSQELASVGRDRSARVLDAQTGEIQFTYAEHQSGVRSVVFDSDAQTAISGTIDGDLRRWLWREEEPDTKEKKAADTKDKTDPAAVIKTGDKAKPEKEKEKAKADAKPKKKSKSTVLKGRRSELVSLVTLGDRMLAASADGHVLSYSLTESKSPQEFFNLGGHLDVLVPDGDGSRVAIGGQDGEVRIVNVADGKLLLKFMASPGIPESKAK